MFNITGNINNLQLFIQKDRKSLIIALFKLQNRAVKQVQWCSDESVYFRSVLKTLNVKVRTQFGLKAKE